MKFWRAVAFNAWIETVDLLHLNSRLGFMLWLVSTLAVIAGLSFWGSADATRDEIVSRIFLGAVTLGMIPFVFAWKFVGEPPKMYRFLCDWTKELEDSIIETKETDTAVYGIEERYQKGLAVLDEGGDLAAWETDFDEYIRENFDASLYLQLCGKRPLQTGYTVIDRGDGRPAQRIQHPAPSEEERVSAKLNKVADMMPYAATNYRGATINSPQFMESIIRLRGLPEHRSPLGIAVEKQP